MSKLLNLCYLASVAILIFAPFQQIRDKYTTSQLGKSEKITCLQEKREFFIIPFPFIITPYCSGLLTFSYSWSYSLQPLSELILHGFHWRRRQWQPTPRDLSPNASGGLTPLSPPSELQRIPVAIREQSGVLCFHSRWMPVSPGASGTQPRDPCRPWRGTLASGLLVVRNIRQYMRDCACGVTEI